MARPAPRHWRQGTTQSVTFSQATAAAIASGVGDHIRAVRVVVKSPAYIAIGPSAVATTSDMYMASDSPAVFSIAPGEVVSAIKINAGTSILYVTELTQ